MRDQSCDYCGLPVRGQPPANQVKLFCCVGCRIAADITSGSDDGRLGRMAFRLGLAIFFSMNVMVFTLALWSWDAYAISQDPRAAVFKELLRLGCLLFATLVVVILGQPLMASLMDQIRSRVFSADGLLLTGVAAAFGYSVLSLLTGGDHIYLEVVCMILLAVTFGRWLEANGKQRAMKSLESLQDMLPDSANVVTGLTTELVALDEVTPGQIVRVLPGERMPLDGRVATGRSYVDERLVTGESAARSVDVGDQVYGGAINLDGALEVEVTGSLEAGVIQRLVAIVRNAARRKSRVERLVDRLATVFAVMITFIAIGVFIWHARQHGFHPALMASMAVVLIACPCALAVATPLAVWAAMGQAAARGIVFRSSDDLLRLAKVDHVCFDKTGTLTTDAPHFRGTVWAPGDEECGEALTRQLAGRTQHPLAAAVLRSFTARVDREPGVSDHAPYEFESCRTVPGCGVVAQVRLPHTMHGKSSGTQVVLGSHAFCREHGMLESPVIAQQLESNSEAGLTNMFIGWGGKIRGCFSFAEETRSNAVTVIDRLRSLGLSVELLTGDRQSRANRLARELQVDTTAELLPEAKLARVEALQNTGRTVAMIGDGLNDAPALGAADVGIAMGCGVEVSRDAADVCLMSSELGLLPWSIRLSRDTQRTIRRNLVWAVSYNLIGIGIASTGRLNPIFAAVAMLLSSALVIGESLRLAARAEASAPAFVERQPEELQEQQGNPDESPTGANRLRSLEAVSS